MTLTILHLTWTPITFLLFVLIARPAANPLLDTGRALRRALGTRGGRTVFGVFLVVLLVNFAECLLDPGVSAWLGYEMTPAMRALEGEWIERVQEWVPAWSLGFLSWVYLSAYIAVLAAPLVVWTAGRRFDALREYTGAFAANYLLALPFYLFFPVQEVGWSLLSAARPLLDVPWPGLTAELRAGSALDNCFPSLHVSCTVTVLWLAHRHGPPGLRILAWIMAPLTALTVMALGIHWGLDVVAGVPFGVACAILGSRAAHRFRS